MIIADLPYSVTHEPWERQVDEKELGNYLEQCDAVNQAEKYVVIFWHKVKDAEIVENAMKSRHLQQIQNFFWYKSGQYSATPVGQYVNAMEMGSIGFYPHATSAPNNLSSHPRDRHNFFQCPSVTTLYKKEDKTPINPCQKPPAVGKWLISNHCPPGGNVLVIGTGAGGEVFGAVEAGCNVVGVEYDIDQYNALSALIVQQQEKLKLEYRQQQERDSKKQSDISPSTASTVSPSTSVVPSSQVDEKDNDSLQQICSECDAKVDREEDERLLICVTCKTGRWLHPNCCSEYEGDIYCGSCNEKLLLEELDEAE